MDLRREGRVGRLVLVLGGREAAEKKELFVLAVVEDDTLERLPLSMVGG